MHVLLLLFKCEVECFFYLSASKSILVLHLNAVEGCSCSLGLQDVNDQGRLTGQSKAMKLLLRTACDNDHLSSLDFPEPELKKRIEEWVKAQRK